MRIAVFIEDYVKGGQNAFIATLINSWPYEDEFIILSNKNNIGLDLIRNRLRRHCSFITYRYNNLHHHHIDFAKYSLPYKYLLKMLIEIRRYLVLFLEVFLALRILDKILPDKLIVSNGGYPGAQACRTAAMSGLFHRKWGKPIFIYHNLPIKPKLLALPIEFVVDWLLEKSVENLITVSYAAQSEMKNRRCLCHSKKLQVIYNGIDNPETVEGLTTVPIKKELNLNRDDKLILTIANFEERKGHKFLLSAMKEVVRFLPNAHLLLAGTGDTKKTRSLKKFVCELGLTEKVHFLGFRNDISRILKQVDVLAVPSQEYESFGLISVEAMAQAVPVVATNVGGIPEVVAEGEGGYCVDRNDIKGFANCISLFLKSEALCKLQGKKGYDRYRKVFLGQRMSKEYSDLVRA